MDICYHWYLPGGQLLRHQGDRADLILQLYNGENWGAHPELAYIYKMRELF